MKTGSKIAIGFLLGLVSGCGFLSNDHIFVGEGTLRGRILIGGKPASGALVFVVGKPEQKVFADSSGGFTLDMDAGRDKTLVVLWGVTHGLQRAFDLAGAGDENLGDLELAPTGILDGKAVLENPRDASITIPGTLFWTQPDNQGRYRLYLPAGRWPVQIEAVGHQRVELDGVQTESGGISRAPEAVLEKDPSYVCSVSQSRIDRFSQGGGGAVDILMIIDSSGSMTGKQETLARSFRGVVRSLEATGVDYRIAVITPGIESPGCPPCSSQIPGSCINETGEGGRFQDRLGLVTNEDLSNPQFDFVTAPGCRVVGSGNTQCLFDGETGRGTVMVGNGGCGYERPFAAMRRALSEPLLSTYNYGFLRPDARLAVIAFGDENDCGEPGDVTENIRPGGKICYYAAKGVGPFGETTHPNDPEQKPYRLTPEEEYRDFLLELKHGNASMVTFGAIAGVTDPLAPETTTIEYETNIRDSEPIPACTMAECSGFCDAYPGTRFVRLAELLGGSVDSICQDDFADAVLRVVGLTTGVRRVFNLRRPPLVPGGISVQVDAQLSAAWDAKLNKEGQVEAIGFDESHTPPPYSVVEASYDAACP